MNQAFFCMSSVGVGPFHSFYPPPQIIRKFFWPNPKSHSNSREIRRNFLECISSPLVSPLVYTKGRGEFLKSCNLLAASSPPTPADNYTKDFYNCKHNCKHNCIKLQFSVGGFLT